MATSLLCARNDGASYFMGNAFLKFQRATDWPVWSRRITETLRRSRFPSATARHQSKNVRSTVKPRRRISGENVTRPGRRRPEFCRSPPSRYSAISIVPTGRSASRRALTVVPPISTTKLKFRNGSCRAAGIGRHLQVGEVAVGSEVVADLTAAALASVAPPRDGHLERGWLAASEKERGAVEEDADAPTWAQEVEAAEDLQPVDARVAAEAV